LVIDEEKDLENVEKEWIVEIVNSRKPVYTFYHTNNLQDKNHLNILSLQGYDLYFGDFVFTVENPKFFDEFLQQLCNLFIIQPLQNLYNFKTQVRTIF
jgi:hypothetical protein